MKGEQEKRTDCGFLFEKLEVYQKAVGFAEFVSNLTSGFPWNCRYLGDQFNRASLSISLNIAEGNGRSSPADRRHFFTVSRGSAHECVPLIELCRRRRLLSDEVCAQLRADLQLVGRMLSGLIESTRE